MRTLLSAIALAAALLGRAGPAIAGDALPAQVNPHVVVTGDYVRLADIWTPAGPKGEAAVAYAPAPGKRSVLDATWLYKVARAYNIDWRPLSTQEQVVVERDSQILSAEEIEDHLHAALIDRGAEADVRVELSNPAMRLYVPSHAAATVAVDDVVYNPRTGRFSAIVRAPAEDPAAQRVRVTGRASKMIEIPVPARRIDRGETVRESDLRWLRVAASKVAENTVTDADQIVGMAPRRYLRPDQPVRVGQLDRPVLVEKGSLVTVVLATPLMTLTAQAKALEDGADGEVIRLTNTKSRAVIEAVVTGPGMATVKPAVRVALN